MFDSQGIQFLDYLGVAVVIVKADDGKIVKANSQMIELTSFGRDELEAMSLSQFFSAEDGQKLLNLFKLEPAQPDQALHEFDFSLRRKSRRKLSVSLAARKMADGQHFLVTIQDNTLIKEAEWQLANAQSRLVEGAKFKALGEMAGGIAHEINNPLAIISGLAETLYYLIKDEKVHQVARKITETTLRISNIISGLKTISRDHSNDPPVPCELHTIVGDTLAFCKERFRSQSIEVHIAPISKDWVILGRPTQLSQVILNLLNNAFDAVKPLKEKWIRIEPDETGGFYRIQVTDSGGGIPKKIQEKIMQPFFTTKEVGNGTGLGLSISKSILESHDGFLRLKENHPNTQFIIELPKISGKQQEKKFEDTASPPPKRKQRSNAETHILVVEDETELAELIAHQLQRRGFKTLTTLSGRQAMEVIKQESGKVDIVLSDIHMDDGDGFWLLDQVNRFTNHTMPFIFVTGSPGISLEEAYHLGAGAVFFKPIRFPALIDTILQMTTPRDQKWSQRLPRIDIEIKVNIRQDDNEARHENLINLGRGGMFVAIKENMPKIGDTVKFEFKNQSGQRIAGTGIVRWIRPKERNSQPPGAGIEFLYIEEASRTLLFNLINSICTYSFIPNELSQDS